MSVQKLSVSIQQQTTKMIKWENGSFFVFTQYCIFLLRKYSSWMKKVTIPEYVTDYFTEQLLTLPLVCIMYEEVSR